MQKHLHRHSAIPTHLDQLSAAENSNTARHAAEFWMIEPEMAFADLKDDMEVAEAMLKYVISYVMENAPGRNGFLKPVCR